MGKFVDSYIFFGCYEGSEQAWLNFWLNLNRDFGSVSSRIAGKNLGKNLQAVRVGINFMKFTPTESSFCSRL